MSKRVKMTEPDARTTVLGCSVFQFRVDYEQSKQLPVDDVVSAGGHLWRAEFSPRGEYVSIFLKHTSGSGSVRAIFEAFLMGSDGKPSASYNGVGGRVLEAFKAGDSWGWSQFLKMAAVEKDFLTEEGHITFVCAVMVIDDDSPIPMPPSDMATHLGHLLDHHGGTADVALIVGDQTFPAHRAVLAARSGLFKDQLFGSMAKAPSIRLLDITPATFKAMLRFVYTDELPAQDELEDSSTEMFQNLLAAADRYALHRLKFICAQKLWDKVSTDTVATILACADTYNCPELKHKCIDFFVLEDNFKEVMFTDGYVSLLKLHPSVAAELKRRIIRA